MSPRLSTRRGGLTASEDGVGSRVTKVTFVLVGHYAGKSVALGSGGKFRFSGGRMTIDLREDEVAKLSRYLEVNYQAYPAGHPALGESEVTDGERGVQEGGRSGSPEEVRGDGREQDGAGSEASPPIDGGGHAQGAGGEAGVRPEGDGHEHAGVRERLSRVIAALDPDVDEHWALDGRPALAAIDQALGSSGTTRAVVEAVAPGWCRKRASQEALEKLVEGA